MDILEKYKKILIMELNKSYSKEDLSNISFEFPRDASHGDFSTNAALILSKKSKLSTIPLEIRYSINAKYFFCLNLTPQCGHSNFLDSASSSKELEQVGHIIPSKVIFYFS